MGEITSIVSVLNLLGLGGLGLFLYYIIKSLKERVANLTELAKEQKDTLEAVRTRALEIERLSKDYKQALTDFQEMGKRLDERRNELVKELELANQRKDLELARLAHLELEEIELKKQSLERLPDLERKLDETVSELGRQIKIVSPSLLVQLKDRPKIDVWCNWFAHNWSDLIDAKTSYKLLYLFLSSARHDIGHFAPFKKESVEGKPAQDASGEADDNEREHSVPKKPEEPNKQG